MSGYAEQGDFVLDIAADLYGCKENLEVRFAEKPTVAELRAKAESLYQIEATVQRPPGEPIQHIRIKRFQIYDDNLRRWMNLDTCGQLQTYAQLYAFQDASSDLQSEIPPSSPPRTRISVPAASPQRQRSAHAPATLMDLKAGVQHSPHAAGLIRDAEQLRRAEPIPGESLLASERENEESRMRLDIDAHRDIIRRETQSFLTQ